MPKLTSIDRRTLIGGTIGAGLASLAAPSVFAQDRAATKLKAFVLGVDRYSHLAQLERAVADAKSVAASLTGCGYSVVHAHDTSRAETVDLFNQFRRDLEPGDAAFLFLAGHGIQLAGEGYILPSDADCSSTDAFNGTVISLQVLLSQLSYRDPSQVIAVVDACRNPLRSVELPGRITGLTSYSAPAEFCLMFSAGAGEYALDSLSEDDDDPNGVFARYFLQNLKPSAQIEDIFYPTAEAVITAAKSVDHIQRPVFSNQSGRRLRVVPEPPKMKAMMAGMGSAPAGNDYRKTGVMLVKCADYDNERDSMQARLLGPQNDVRAMQGYFERLGASVRLVDEPDVRTLRLACEEFSAAGFERMVFYYSGAGGLALNDGMIDLHAGEEGKSFTSPTYGERRTILPLMDLYRLLRPDAATPAATDTPIYMFIDSCLSDYGIAATEDSAESLIEKLRRGERLKVSVLYSGAYGQSALDEVAQGQGALSLALAEAFRPGVRLGEITAEVRRKVAILTEGEQTPQLFASWDMEDSIPLPLAS